MANAIGFSLQLSLGCASTQYLWHLVRVNSYNAALLDDLFSPRSNILALIRVLVKKEAILLTTLSLFILFISVVVSFPPGAITVKQASQALEAAMPSFGHFDVSLSSPMTFIPPPLIFQAIRGQYY
jgi:hypothetical protein